MLGRGRTAGVDPALFRRRRLSGAALVLASADRARDGGEDENA